MALSAYRNLLRSARVAFQGIPLAFQTTFSFLIRYFNSVTNVSTIEDDTRVLASALAAARSKFDSCRSLTPNSSEAKAAIELAEGVAGILRRNIVQGRGNGEDKFRESLLFASHSTAEGIGVVSRMMSQPNE